MASIRSDFSEINSNEISKVRDTLSYSVSSKFINFGEALSQKITFFIVYISGSDVNKRRNRWDNLFRKFSVVKSEKENF
jgi:hypothetical protein